MADQVEVESKNEARQFLNAWMTVEDETEMIRAKVSNKQDQA